MGRIVEGFWDCSYCGETRIRGSVRECPNCGRHRDDSVKFYMDGLNYVDEDKAKTISKNPDWLCSYCDALNSDNVNECVECGASREDSEKNYFENRADVERRRVEKEALAHGNSDSDDNSYNESVESYRSISDQKDGIKSGRLNKRESSASFYDDYDSSVVKSNTNKRKLNLPWGNIFKIGAGVLAAIMLVMCLVWVFTPKIQEVTIQDFSWERNISVEEYKTVEESDWYLPSGARLQYSQQEIRGYEQVLDHYETRTREYTEQVLDHYETYVSGYRDLGNGYFEEITSERPVYRTETRTETYQEPVYRDEPIYATKYYYEIDKWMYDYSSKSSGNDKEPYWEEPELDTKHREGGRSEKYYITVINDDGEEVKYSFDFDTWESLNSGDSVTIKTTVFGTAELVIDDKVVATGGR